MFFWRSRKTSAHPDDELWEKMKLLVTDMEAFKREAEKKIHLHEKSAADRCQELEEKLKVLEERILVLNQVLTFTDPDKRIN